MHGENFLLSAHNRQFTHALTFAFCDGLQSVGANKTGLVFHFCVTMVHCVPEINVFLMGILYSCNGFVNSTYDRRW